MPWFSDRAGSAGGSRIAPSAVWPSTLSDGVGTPITLISRLNSPACTYRYRRFACALTGADARLAATVGRYSFGVELFHLLLRAGLSRRTTQFPAS